MSLIAIVVIFGYVFLQTDVIAAKGAGEAMGFPVIITLIAIFSIWFAGYSKRRGWVG